MKKYTPVTNALSFIVIVVSFVYFLTATPSDLATKESVFTEVNKKRQECGLVPLLENKDLDLVAEKRVEDMHKYDYFEHENPQTKTTAYSFLEEQGYDYNYAGENIAKNFLSTKDAVDAWLNSDSHRDNIINVNYTETGVALSRGLLVQIFGAK